MSERARRRPAWRATPHLREALDRRDANYSKVGRRIGVSRSYLSDAMAGRRTVPEHRGRALADYLGEPFEALFSRTDEPSGQANPR